MQRQSTDTIVFHCSATRPSQNIGRREIEEWHLAKGWSGIGYHFVIMRDGTLQKGREIDEVGAHVAGANSHTLGVCLVGGLGENGQAFADAPQMFTLAQWDTARALMSYLRKMYPNARVCGHRDLSPDLNKDGKIQQSEWLKTCPGFDAAREFKV